MNILLLDTVYVSNVKDMGERNKNEYNIVVYIERWFNCICSNTSIVKIVV